MVLSSHVTFPTIRCYSLLLSSFDNIDYHWKKYQTYTPYVMGINNIYEGIKYIIVVVNRLKQIFKQQRNLDPELNLVENLIAFH